MISNINIPQASSAGSSSSDGYPSSVSGSVVTNNCFIGFGKDKCLANSLFTWSGVGTFAVATARGGSYYEGISGSSPQLKGTYIGNGGNSISLLGSVDGGSFNTISGPIYVYADCAPGLGWNGLVCVLATGNISASNCEIPSRGSTCSITVNWSTNNVDYARVITSNYPSANSRVFPDLPAPFTSLRSGSATRTIPYGSTSFYIYSNSFQNPSGVGGVQIASGTATATCVAGTFWNGINCITSNPTIEVFANNVKPKYTTTSPANIQLRWEAFNFPNNTRVTCKLVTLVNGSPVSIVKGLPYFEDRYPYTGYLNPTAANTTYRVTCSDEILTSMSSSGATTTGCIIYAAGGSSCDSDIIYSLQDPNGVFNPLDLRVYTPYPGFSIYGDWNGEATIETRLSTTNPYANGTHNDLNMSIRTGYNDYILVDSFRAVATCNQTTLVSVEGMEQCISWDQYMKYLECKSEQPYTYCLNQPESCYFSACAPYPQS